MDNWNISTNVWLRQYIYVRLKAGGGIGASLATLATFMSSAIWHGFYAGYYLTFASVSILTSLARVMRRTFRPLVVNPVTQEEHPIKPVYDVISWFLTQCSINYLVMPFQLLTFHDSWAAWRANKFIVQWCMAILYIWLVYAGGARWVRRTFGPAEAGKPKSNGAAASKQTNEKTAVGANVTYAEAPLTSS
jgi:D-alanyl-lipoteichoic acid acyltransferase DltB (MBOAT superfamily)